MTLILKGRRVACDGDHCGEVYDGPWPEASRAGWLSPVGLEGQHYCPTCAAPIREALEQAALSAQQAIARQRKSVEQAEALVRLIEEEGGPRTRVWQGATAGVRLYFPGSAGYLSFSGSDITDRMHSKQTFEPRALWPAWRRAYDRAVARYRAMPR